MHAYIASIQLPVLALLLSIPSVLQLLLVVVLLLVLLLSIGRRAHRQSAMMLLSVKSAV
jgi:hypothetical protein